MKRHWRRFWLTRPSVDAVDAGRSCSPRRGGAFARRMRGFKKAQEGLAAVNFVLADEIEV
jgi:hypothetical protein